jgi:ABC-type glycerol-3-phosphate transport system substrate-binding protein
MKKRLALILSLSILLGICAAVLYIYKPDGSEKTEIRQKSLKQVQLTFWRNKGNDSENKAYEELVNSFEKANPEIEITMKLIPYSDYEIRLRTEIATGTPPDIMAIDSPTLALYANAGSLLSIDSFMKKEGNQLPNQVLPFFITSMFLKKPGFLFHLLIPRSLCPGTKWWRRLK